MGRLTPAFTQAYIPAVAGNKQRPGVETRMRRRSAASNMQRGYFFALAYLNGGPGGAAARLADASSVFPPPFGLPPLRGKSGGGFNTATEANTMSNDTKGTPTRRTAAPLPFYSYDAAKNPLFSINKNVPFEALLEHAGCFMMSVEECMLNAASEVDHPSAWGAFYMAQMAKAIIESMQISLTHEPKQ